jgi:hypothetical protein
MRKLPLILLVVLLTACSHPSKEEMASLAAKGYYEHLIKGETEQFLAGRVGADSLPESYRSQLLDAYRQFVAQQEQNHLGIQEVRIVRAQTDSLADYTNVFLTLCFGDSTNEEIVVPMVEQGEGRWRMR